MDGGTVGIASTRVPCLGPGVVAGGVGGGGAWHGSSWIRWSRARGRAGSDSRSSISSRRSRKRGSRLTVGPAVAAEGHVDHGAATRPGSRRQHVDALAEVDRLLHVVGDHEDGGAGALPDGEQEVLHRPLGLGVEGAEGLVEQQHVGLRAPGPGRWRPAGACRPTARRGSRSANCGEPRDAEQLVDPLGACRLRVAGALEAEGDVLRAPSSTGTASTPGRPCPGPGPGPTTPLAVDLDRARRSRVSSPPTMLSSVDLPQPEAPTMARPARRRARRGRRRRGRRSRSRRPAVGLAPGRRTRQLAAGAGDRRSWLRPRRRAVAQPAQEQVARRRRSARRRAAGRTCGRCAGTAGPG